MRFSKNFDRSFALTNRLRREGTDALLAAAHEAGVRRFVAQSFANLRYARVGGPVNAKVLGAKPPRHFPVWLARLFAGEAGVMLGTEARGASNAKAKRELGWTLRYPSWRQGFAEVYAKTTASPEPASASPSHP